MDGPYREGARPRAPRLGRRLLMYSNALPKHPLGFDNKGSRGRDPSRRWVMELPIIISIAFAPNEN
jgi:hypothetical protein